MKFFKKSQTQTISFLCIVVSLLLSCYEEKNQLKNDKCLTIYSNPGVIKSSTGEVFHFFLTATNNCDLTIGAVAEVHLPKGLIIKELGEESFIWKIDNLKSYQRMVYSVFVKVDTCFYQNPLIEIRATSSEDEESINIYKHIEITN